jgi:hypothetical protein
MIKKKLVYPLIFYIFFILKSSVISASDNIEGLMDCTIKGIKIIKINEGIHEEFSGVEGVSAAGDKFTISYKNTKTSHFSLIMPTFWESNHIFSFFIIKENASVGYNRATKNREAMMYLRDKNEVNQIAWNYDVIYADNTNNSLTLRRYFKNDWNGLYVNHVGLTSTNVTFECRNNYNQLENIFYKLYPGEKSK